MRDLKTQQDAGIILMWCIFLSILVVLLFAKPVRAEDYEPVMVCNAIFHAEGGAKAQYLYGIRSVHYKDLFEARHICLNTVKHAKKDYLRETGGKIDFIAFLGSRYAPVGAKNDPKHLNNHWIKNVRYWLRKDAHVK